MLPSNTITSQEEFLQLFLRRNILMTIVLTTYEGLFEFKQRDIETLGQVQDWIKKILRDLIGNCVEITVQLEYFYVKLDVESKVQFDVISGRSIWKKTTLEITILLENVASNDVDWSKSSNCLRASQWNFRKECHIRY